MSPIKMFKVGLIRLKTTVQHQTDTSKLSMYCSIKYFKFGCTVLV